MYSKQERRMKLVEFFNASLLRCFETKCSRRKRRIAHAPIYGHESPGCNRLGLKREEGGYWAERVHDKR
jgi:hypothetical protein